MSTNPISLLIVDDEDSVCRLLAASLRPLYNCTTARSAAEAVTMLTTAPFNLVLSDITMPGASGLELCKFVREKFPETVVIMVSAMTDIEYAIEAMKQGAFDYIVKPFDLISVMLAVDRALKHQALLSFKRNYEESLETTVRLRTIELSLVNDNLNRMIEVLYSNYRATLRSLAKALEARDVETRDHSDRVVAYCLRIGRQLGLTQRELIGLEQGALLHDMGKIGVRDSILLKPEPLTEQEWVEMRKHVAHGLRIIDGIDFLSSAGAVVGQHHEKYDGSGYPKGLQGDAIHINARIFAVADAFDAVTSDRPYRAAQSCNQACVEIITHSGTHFDPKIVEAFLAISETELADIRRLAETQDYSAQIIDEREIRSFIVSLKDKTNLHDHLEIPGLSTAAS